MQLVDFGGLVLDYEGMAVHCGARRRLLGVKEFAVLEALLWAEGRAVTTEQLAAACRVASHRYRRDVASRLVLRLRRAFLSEPGIAIMGSSGEGWRLRQPPRPGAVQCPQAPR